MEKTVYKFKWKNCFIEVDYHVCCIWFLFNMLTVFALYLNEIFAARIIFGSCCLSMMVSIVVFMREIHVSTNALKLHMSDMDVDLD